MRTRHDQLTVTDLVVAYFDAARWHGAVRELRGYHRKRLAILTRLFRFSLPRELRVLSAPSTRASLDSHAVSVV